MRKEKYPVSGLLFAGALLLQVLWGCSLDRDDNDGIQVRQHKAALTLSKPCTLVALPTADPNKPKQYTCTKPTLPPESPALLAARAAYMNEWQKEAETWSGLSEDQKEAKRRALKETYLPVQVLGVEP